MISRARSLGRWLGIGAVSAAILFTPIWNGASQAAQESNVHFLYFDPGQLGAKEMDCNDFEGRRSTRRFFRRHGGPQKDRHGLDADADGKPCEGDASGR